MVSTICKCDGMCLMLLLPSDSSELGIRLLIFRLWPINLLAVVVVIFKKGQSESYALSFNPPSIPCSPVFWPFHC